MESFILRLPYRVKVNNCRVAIQAQSINHKIKVVSIGGKKDAESRKGLIFM